MSLLGHIIVCITDAAYCYGCFLFVICVLGIHVRCAKMACLHTIFYPSWCKGGCGPPNWKFFAKFGNVNAPTL